MVDLFTKPTKETPLTVFEHMKQIGATVGVFGEFMKGATFNDWDLSINRYKEIEYAEMAYDAPKYIIADIEQLDRERNEALNLF